MLKLFCAKICVIQNQQLAYKSGIKRVKQGIFLAKSMQRTRAMCMSLWTTNRYYQSWLVQGTWIITSLSSLTRMLYFSWSMQIDLPIETWENDAARENKGFRFIATGHLNTHFYKDNLVAEFRNLKQKYIVRVNHFR